jgi:hypothetical protein
VSHVTTLPYRRQQVTPRSGGRIAGDLPSDVRAEVEHRSVGTAALAARPAARAGRERAGPAAPALRVAPPAPVRTPRTPFVTLVLFLVIAGVLGILVLNTKINENAFRLNDLHRGQGTLDLQEQQLSQDLADQESPNSLAAAARRLGLVRGTPAYIRLPDGQVLGVPQPASGQPSVSGDRPDNAAPGGTPAAGGSGQPGR